MENKDAKLEKIKMISAGALILIGIGGRFALVSYVRIPNLEIVTALTLVSGIYLGGIYTAVVPLSVIFLSDLAIGNNYIFIFTWTAFVLIGLLGAGYRRWRIAKRGFQITRDNFKAQLPEAIGLGISSSLFFFIWTNFGWWLISGMYEHNLAGLIKCYWMAIPFFKNNLIGNLVFVPIGIYAASKALCWAKSKNWRIQKYCRNITEAKLDD